MKFLKHKRFFSWILTFVMLATLIPTLTSAAEYTTCASGTVSWQMIHDNPDTYYWIDADGDYCVLTGTRSGGYYYVTLYRPGKSNGTELRYLRQDKSDDSASEHEWSSASAKYTGGVLYKKGGGSSSTKATITLSKSSLSVTKGSTGTVSATPSGCTVSGVSSSNTSVATVTRSGNTITVTGVSAGTATITVSGTASSGYTAPDAKTFKVTVTDSGSGGGTGGETTPGVLPDGTYTWTGQVSFSKDDYSISVTVTVSGGKFTSITSVPTSTPRKSDSEKEYHPNAVTNVSGQIKGKAATMDTINGIADAKSGATYSIQGIKGAMQKAESDIPSSGGGGDNPDPGDPSITNPATATGNGLSLNKTLSYDQASDSYTITLTARATSGGSSGAYQIDGYDKKYRYSDLNSGEYYYLYNGTYYQVRGLKYYSSEKGKDYYCGYFTIGNTKYYLDKRPAAYSNSELDKEHPGDNDADKAYKSCKQDKVSDGKELPLYTKTGSSSGTTVGSGAYLRDVVNTSAFDVSNAKATIVSGSGATRSFANGSLSVTGYDYTGNYGGTPLVVTISGLKAQPKVNGTVRSNSGDAAIYSGSSTSSGKLVSVTSPTATIQGSTITEYTYQLNYNANGGSGAPAAQTATTSLQSHGFTIPATVPTRAGYTFLGWDTSRNAQNAGYRAGDIFSLSASSPTGTLYAVWEEDMEPSLADGDYGDHTVEVAEWEYTPVVRVTVSGGKITDVYADAETNENNLDYLSEAVDWIKERLVGKTATETAADNIDAITQATAQYSKTALKSAIQKALKEGVDGPYTIAWKADGSTLQSDAGIRYGQRSADYAYKGSTPEKAADSSYTYTFRAWDPVSMPDFVTGNQTYTAQFDAASVGKQYALTVDDVEYDYADGSGSGAWIADYSGYGMTVHPYYRLTMNGTPQYWRDKDGINGTGKVSGYPGITDAYYIEYTPDDPEMLAAYPEGMDDEIWFLLSGKAGTTTVTMTLYEKDSNGSKGNRIASTDFRLTVKKPVNALEDGLYIDGTKAVETFGYHPTVSVQIEDGVFKGLEIAAADVGSNQSFLEKAIQYFEKNLLGKPAASETIDALNVIDAKTGATLSAKAIKAGLLEAVAAENIIQYRNDPEILYCAHVSTGTATPRIDDPTDPDKNFAGWNPAVAAAVTGSQTYDATWASTAVATIGVSQNALELNEKTTGTLSVTKEGCTVQATSADPAIASVSLSGNRLMVRGLTPGETTITLTGTPETGYAAPAAQTVTVRVYPVAADGKYVDGTIEITETHEEFYQQTSSTYHATVTVTVKDGKIADIRAASDDVNWVDSQWFKEYALPRLQELIGQPASELDVKNLDAVSGATFSTTALKTGTIHALQAKNRIQWVDEGGSPVLDQAWMTTGTVPVYDGDTPTKANYTFSAWTPEITPVSGDAVYTAVYTENPKYSVTYDLDGGEGSIVDPGTYYEGETVTVQTGQPVKAGFEFKGWSFPGGRFDDNTYRTFAMPAGGATLKAIWEEIQDAGLYGSYETVDGLVSRYAEQFGSDFDIAAFQYKMAGSEDPLLVVLDIDAENTITDFRVDLEDADAAAEFADAAAMIREIFAEEGAEATIENLQFVMAYLEAIYDYDVEGYTDILVAMMHAIELGARSPYTIAITEEDGTALTSYPGIRYGTRTGDVVKEPATDASGQNREFDHWSPQLSTFVLEDATYAAHFRSSAATTATVTFRNADGSVLDTQTVETGTPVTYGGSEPAMTDPAGEYDYDFAGWVPASDPDGEPVDLSETPVTGDCAYQAKYDARKTGWKIILEDYTGGILQTSLDPDAFYRGEVRFTAGAPAAVVIARQNGDAEGRTDGTGASAGSAADPAYERLFGVDNGDGTFTFTVTMPGNADLRLVAGWKGDVGLDGSVTIKDSTLASHVYTGLAAVNPLQILFGDVDGDGSLNLKDSTLISQYYAETDTFSWDVK